MWGSSPPLFHVTESRYTLRTDQNQSLFQSRDSRYRKAQSANAKPDRTARSSERRGASHRHRPPPRTRHLPAPRGPRASPATPTSTSGARGSQEDVILFIPVLTRPTTRPVLDGRGSSCSSTAVRPRPRPDPTRSAVSRPDHGPDDSREHRTTHRKCVQAAGSARPQCGVPLSHTLQNDLVASHARALRDKQG